MSRRVFISYSRKDGNDYAEKLQTQLESAGFTVWRDTRNINPAQDFTAEIEIGIEQADIVAVCVTPDIKRANSFVRREIQYAAAVNKPTFPCRVVEIPPIISIINNEWLEFHRDWDASFQRLCQLVIDPNLNNPSGTYQQAPDEPFKDYLQALYRQIVRYLDQAVIRLIDLEAEATPDAVPRKRTDDILLEFFESSIFATPQDDKVPSYKTFAEAFEYHNGRLLLLGEPGAGKTITLMSHARDAVAARLDDPQKPLPILKIVATWQSNPPMPIADWCAGQLFELKPIIESGKAQLLLDGLDELGEQQEIRTEKKDPRTGEIMRNHLTNEPVTQVVDKFDPRSKFIETIVSINPANQILLTSRVQDYMAIGQQIPLDGAVTLQPLTDIQLADYLENHPLIFNTIRNDNTLRDLARTPLLLSLITFAFDKLDENLKTKGNLSSGDVRDVIFETYCRQRYDHEARKKNADLAFTYREMLEILGELAMWNASDYYPYKSGSRRMRGIYQRTEVNVLPPQIFRVVLSNSELISKFYTMTTRINILAPIDENNYRFTHLLLRDFLAYTFALPRISEKDWWYDDNINPITSLGNLADKRATAALTNRLLNSDSIVKKEVIRSLGKIGDVSAIDSLLVLLDSLDNSIRHETIRSLGKIGGEKAIQSLSQLITRNSETLRETVALALGAIGGSATATLINLLKSSDSFTRIYIAIALKKIGEPAIDNLIRLFKESDISIIGHAIEIIGSIGGNQSVEYLITFLNNNYEFELTIKTLEALGNIGSDEASNAIVNFIVYKRGYTQTSLINILKKFEFLVTDRLAHLLSKNELVGKHRICDISYYTLQQMNTPQTGVICIDWILSGNTYYDVD